MYAMRDILSHYLYAEEHGLALNVVSLRKKGLPAYIADVETDGFGYITSIRESQFINLKPTRLTLGGLKCLTFLE